MEQRLNDLEVQQRTLKSRLDNIERLQREANFTLRDIAHKATIILGHTTVTSEETSDFKLAINERFDRLDSRVAEAHKGLAELEIAVKEIKSTMATKDDIVSFKTQQNELLKQILAKLQ